MDKEFTQVQWDELIQDDLRQIVRLAVREDLDRTYDWTSVALVPPECRGNGVIVARASGIVAGVSALSAVIDEMDASIHCADEIADGSSIQRGDKLATLSGSVRDLFVAERFILNLLGKLSGIATLTHQYVQAVAGTQARIYDTRKTTPGFRRLEKYAVRCGGGHNHRTGLYEAILIKDNHLAFGACSTEGIEFSPAAAVQMARDFLDDTLPGKVAERMIVEVEIDDLSQLDQVLAAQPDIILLDNMTLDQLNAAVHRRDRAGADIELEASGGINLTTIRSVAETGVDRISVGALTHSAVNLDVGLDWSNK